MKKRRTVSQPAPTRAESTIQTWLVRAVVLAVAIACVGRLWLLDAVFKQRYVSVIRGRPTRIFYADSDPQRFWISIGWDAALTCTLLAVIVWFAYAGWKSHRRRRRQRRRAR